MLSKQRNFPVIRKVTLRKNPKVSGDFGSGTVFRYLFCSRVIVFAAASPFGYRFPIYWWEST